MMCLIHGESGEKNFWSMARYAQEFGNDEVCKAIILKSLGEPDCPNVSDLLAKHSEERIVTEHAKTVTTLLRHNCARDNDVLTTY